MPTIRTAAVIAAASLAAVGATTAGAQPTAHAARAFTVHSMTTRIGRILVDGNGEALYIFTRDRGTSNSCVRVSGCSGTWPTITTTGRPIAGAGVRAGLLGTTRVGGRLQVTYAGHPLYTYAASRAVGATGYIGTNEFGGAWDAITVAGKVVR